MTTMVLGFKTQNNGKPTGFPEKIIAGTKIHTLREDPNNRWQPGNGIQFATGVRTQKYHMFMSGQCKSVQTVEMELHGSITISIDGRPLTTVSEYAEFGMNDGFDSWSAFEFWFYPLVEKAIDKARKKGERPCLKLKLIHWTEKRY